MGKLPCPVDRFLGARSRLVGRPAEPQDASEMTEAAHLRVVPAELMGIGRALPIVERDAVLEMCPRGGQLRRSQAVAAHRMMPLDQDGAVAGLFAETKQLPGERASRRQIAPDAIERLESTEDHEPLRDVPDTVGQGEGTRVDGADLRRREALELRECRAEGNLGLELVERARPGTGRPRQLVECGTEVRRGLGEGIALDGLVAGMAVIREGTTVISGAREVRGERDGDLRGVPSVGALESLADALVEPSPH